MARFWPIVLLLSIMAASFSVSAAYAQLGDTQTASGVINVASSFAPQPVNVNSDFTLDSLTTTYEQNDTRAPAGVLTGTATFTNQSSQTYSDITFEVAGITPGNEILNADGGAGGTGSTISTGQTVAPGGILTQVFEIGRQALQPFHFLWDMFGTPE